MLYVYTLTFDVDEITRHQVLQDPFRAPVPAPDSLLCNDNEAVMEVRIKVSGEVLFMSNEDCMLAK